MRLTVLGDTCMRCVLSQVALVLLALARLILLAHALLGALEPDTFLAADVLEVQTEQALRGGLVEHVAVGGEEVKLRAQRVDQALERRRGLMVRKIGRLRKREVAAEALRVKGEEPNLLLGLLGLLLAVGLLASQLGLARVETELGVAPLLLRGLHRRLGLGDARVQRARRALDFLALLLSFADQLVDVLLDVLAHVRRVGRDQQALRAGHPAHNAQTQVGHHVQSEHRRHGDACSTGRVRDRGADRRRERKAAREQSQDLQMNT